MKISKVKDKIYLDGKNDFIINRGDTAFNFIEPTKALDIEITGFTVSVLGAKPAFIERMVAWFAITKFIFKKM